MLVSVAIVGILFTLLLVAVQQSREAARRMTCSANLRQMGIAVKLYEQTYRYIVPGNGPGGFSLHVRLLPLLGQQPLYDKINFSKKISDKVNEPVSSSHGLSVFNCPSNPVDSSGRSFTNYIGSAGGGAPESTNGYFVNIGEVGLLADRDIRDGFSNTIILSEAIAYSKRLPGEPPLIKKGTIRKTINGIPIPSQMELLIAQCKQGPFTVTNATLGNEWVYGSEAVTRFIHILPPNQPSCQNDTSVSRGVYTPSSSHVGGVHGLSGDGSVHFVSNSIDRNVWVALGTRSGEEVSSTP